MRALTRLTSGIFLVSAIFLLSACKSAEERAEEHFQSALSLIAEEDVDRAIVELRNVFELNGSHRDARRTMAELQLERGNRQGAYRQYLRLAEQYPDDLETRILLTELAFPAGNWDEVDRHGAKAEELAPEDRRVQSIALVRAYRAAARDDNAPARRDLGRQADTMLAEQPENVLLRNTLLDNAIREQDYARALAEIDWLIAHDPTSRNYQERLRVLAQLGDMKAVEAQLREMIEIFPEEPAHKTTLIRFYLSRDDLDAAETFLRELVAASDPGETGPRIDLIRFLNELRSTEAARAELEKAIPESPDPVPFQVMAAALDFNSGKRAEAIEALEAVLAGSEPSEQNRDNKVRLAQMLLATGNEVGARKQVEEVLAEDETHPAALKMLAAWQITADDTDAAISGLRTALDKAPEDAETMNLMADAYARAGQPELAKDFLAQAVDASGNAPAETLRYARLLIGEKSYLSAEDILLNALRIDTSNVDILATLGRLYLQMEDFGRARSVVDALRRNGGDAAIQAANGIEAERLNRERGSDEAMAFLEDLASDAEATFATRIAFIRARLATGDGAVALALAQELKQENPDNETLDAVLAVAHAVNGDSDAATSLYRDLLATDPARPGIWLELSRLYLFQGDREAAKAAIDEGLDHSPENTNLLWAKASYQEQDGDIDGAIAIYETLYEQNSSSVLVANNLASLLATHRDDEASLDRAWVIARRLRDADSPALQDTYGWILHRRGNSAEALPYLEGAAEGLPQDPLVQYHLGQAYNALDRPEDALEQFRKAVEIASPADTRPQIQEARTLAQSSEIDDTIEN